MSEIEGPGSGGEAIALEPRPRTRTLVRWLRRLEWFSLVAGAAMILLFVGARLHSAGSQRLQLAAFDRALGAAAETIAARPVDQTLWSENRIAKYQESLSQPFAPPLAVLRIPKIGLKVAVLPGTDELTLNRAVGLIAGTAVPGTAGNAGIAGHRDGFFRGLKEIVTGDRLEIETTAGKQEYRVTSIRIVDPTAVEVLAPSSHPVLTLVTCYPFYFVGKAPQRYIVRAEIITAAEGSVAGQDRRAVPGFDSVAYQGRK